MSGEASAENFAGAFFCLTADSQKAGKMYRQYSGNRGIIPPFISYLVQKEIPAAG